MWLWKKRTASVLPKPELSYHDVRSKIVEFVVSRSVASEGELGPGAVLFSSGLLGSMELVQLAIFIEREFGVRPADFMRVSPEGFDHLDELARGVVDQSKTQIR